MAVRASSVVAGPLAAVLSRGGVVGGLSDGQSLDRFATGPREVAELAFETLLPQRHGPMVLRVCQRVLDLNDAEDAFQATFLVLPRHAVDPQIWPLSPAGCTASPHADRGAGQGGGGPSPPDGARGDPARRLTGMPDADRQDFKTLIHDQLDRLPEKYRAHPSCSATWRVSLTKSRPIGSAGRSARCGAGCRGSVTSCEPG